MSALYANFQPFAKEKQLDFRLELSAAHWYMNFDHEKLHRILNNLLSNAFKFTPEGGRVVLSLSAEEVEGHSFANITVSDTGIGISDEALKHIFERFLSSTASGRQQGWKWNWVAFGEGICRVT